MKTKHLFTIRLTGTYKLMYVPKRTHRGKAAKSVTKAQVEDHFDFIKRLVTKTGGAVNSHVKKVTGKPLWPTLRRRRAPIR